MPFPRQQSLTAGKNLDSVVLILGIDVAPRLEIFKEEFWNEGISHMQMNLYLLLFGIVFWSKLRHAPSASQTQYLKSTICLTGLRHKAFVYV